MANENKNIHELASESDEDTSELEALHESLAQTDVDYEFESDAATHSFENLDRQRQDESLATLQLELRDRDGEIGRLEYEIEQLRARSAGLETELRAREDATGNLLGELAEARKTLAGARERLERRDEKLARLDTHVRAQEERLAETARALEEARRSAESSQAERENLEQLWQEASGRIAALTAEVDRERAAHARAREQEQSHARARHELEERHGEARSLLETLRQYIEGRKAQWEQQEVLLRTKDALLDEQQRKIRQYANDAGQQEARLRREQAASEVLRARQADLEDENARLRGELDDAVSKLDSAQAARGPLEARQSALQDELAALAVTNEALERTVAEHEEAAAFRLAEIDALAAQLAELSHEHEKERNDRQSLDAQCSGLEEQMASLRAEMAEARNAADAARASGREHERLSGLLIGQRDELRELRRRLEQSDGYADALRRKLAGHAAEVEANAVARQDLQAARAEVEELTSQLESEGRRQSELATEHEQDRRRFEQELERLRLDLTTAEETIAETQTVNEQLPSDRVETSSFRVALESHLSEADETYRQQVKELNRELKKLRQQVEDYEHKISSKDAAIGVLLAELASKPQPPDEETASEPVIHRLAERRSPAPAPEDRPATPDRGLARLLIGTVDGQEVRFPLFKNKLTIGRTANNDIQLRAQYISRRHAVVVCDNESTRIVDWGSKNGIYVNSVRVSEKILKNGDQVTVGTAEFRFEERPKR